MHPWVALALAATLALAACGCAPPTLGVIDGAGEKIGFVPVGVAAGTFQTYDTEGGLRLGLMISIASDPLPCDPQRLDPRADRRSLLISLYDTDLGGHSVLPQVDRAPLEAQVATVLFAVREDGSPGPHRHAVAGSVDVTSISPAPTPDTPLATGAVVEGTFTIEILLEEPENLGCSSICDAATGECTPMMCSCQWTDGSISECLHEPDRWCCLDGLTETYTVTGWFQATHCELFDALLV